MSNGKPKIFISHITEEAEIAGFFKNEIETRFLGMVDVFVSTDAGSLSLGRNWLDDITETLRECAAMLVFCSPYSIGRPWINFECGAGWARAIEIAPICHSGTRPVDLPLPISLLQGVEASDANRISEVFQMIAGKLRSQTPSIDSKALVAKVLDFENRYVENTEIHTHLRTIKAVSTQLLDVLSQLKPGVTFPINGVPENLIKEVTPSLNALQSRKVLSYSYGVTGMNLVSPGSSGGGNIGTLTISLQPTLVAAILSLTKKPSIS